MVRQCPLHDLEHMPEWVPVQLRGSWEPRVVLLAEGGAALVVDQDQIEAARHTYQVGIGVGLDPDV